MEFRHEYKFIISISQSLLLKERLSGLMKKDINSGKKGSYEIRSIYFDDIHNSCFKHNEAGTVPGANDPGPSTAFAAMAFPMKKSCWKKRSSKTA